MKLVCISDIHGDIVQDKDLPDGDVLIMAGDLLPDGYRPVNREIVGSTRIIQQGWWYDDVFLPWLSHLSGRYKDIIFIGGNHDFFFAAHFLKGVPIKLPPNVHYLDESSVEINGVKFFGAPWNSTRMWAFCLDEEGYWDKLSQVPTGIDVFITHGPPSVAHMPGFHYCSYALSTWLTEKGQNLKALICGHVHEAYGVYEFGNVPVYVVSTKDRDYRLVNDAVEIEL